jgi:class 3 adenylate cyclase
VDAAIHDDVMAEGPSEDTLVVVVIREPGRVALRLELTGVIEVGRDCAGVLLVDPQISRRHLSLSPDGPAGVVITDLGSSNGTTVDGVRVQAPRTVGPGELVRFGSCTIEVATGVAEVRELPRVTSIDRVAAAVVAEGTDLTRVDVDAGTITIVFSDIEGSTRRSTQLGDALWIEVLSMHNAIVRRQVGRHGGTEVKTLGDGFMLSFPSARRAIACMIDVQEALAMHNASHPEQAVRVRVGIHTGEVVMGESGDLFGQHVNLAARVAGRALGSEILVSPLVRELVEPRGDVSFGEPRTVELAGFTGTHRLHPVVWGRAGAGGDV